jgi:trans-aconitate methyltransferase
MERITATDPVGPARYGHEFRYHLAAGFIAPTDSVLDAACGTGYGFKILKRHGMGNAYVGVDRIDLAETELADLFYVKADLKTWFPAWGSDVFLGFETIEHLSDYSNYIDVAHQVNKWIILSTPVVPTVHVNPSHVHDFIPGQLREMFQNEDWEHYQTVQQPSELSEIVILRRRT